MTATLAIEATQKKDEEGAADFETAIAKCGYGLYNIILMIVAIPIVMATNFESTSISFILASAECDLKMSLLDKGILNAMTYTGMITAGFAWGYLADTKGRKVTLVLGLILNSISTAGAALSQTFVMLLIFKFFGGLTIAGTYGAFLAYIAEMHGKAQRARTLMLTNSVMPLSNIVIAALAVLTLPLNIDKIILGLRFHSWQLFLVICMLPSLVGGIVMIFMPESPKFLMSGRRHAKALQVFSKIYAMNKRQPREAYPIKELKDEEPQTAAAHPSTDTDTDHKSKSWKEGIVQLKPLIHKPLLRLSLQVLLATFLALLGVNTFRLWLPQLFSSIKEYEQLPNYKDQDSSICTILEYGVNKSKSIAMENDLHQNDTCGQVNVSVDAYISNIIVAIIGFIIYLLSSVIVNFTGVKRLLIISFVICGTSGLCVSLLTSYTLTVALASFYTSFGSITVTLLLSSAMMLFPTSLRTMIVALALIFGRLGGIVGNILFPVFMSFGCIPPFLLISLVQFFAAILCIFLPVDSKSSLK